MKSNHTPKRLPPFGKDLLNYIQEHGGLRINELIWIFVGDYAWQRAVKKRDFCHVICLPPGTSPSQFLWPVKNTYPFIVDTGCFKVSTLKKLALILLEAGAIEVSYLAADQRTYLLFGRG